jgi:hypothetical protein
MQLTTINDGMKKKDLELLSSRVMPDGAMALAIRFKDQVIVTRMYLTELVGFLHQNHLNEDAYARSIGATRKKNGTFKIDMNLADYHVINESDLKGEWYKAIPQYKQAALEDKSNAS